MVRSDSSTGNSPVEFRSLTASRNAETVQAVIQETWGFTPPLEYCIALIAFIEDMTDGQQQRPRR